MEPNPEDRSPGGPGRTVTEYAFWGFLVGGGCVAALGILVGIVACVQAALGGGPILQAWLDAWATYAPLALRYGCAGGAIGGGLGFLLWTARRFETPSPD